MSNIDKKAYTVKQINMYIKNMFDHDYQLSCVSVQGEVSNCKYHSSGHIYFSIKDSSGTLSCIMFAGSRRNLNFKLEEGQKVVVTGKITIYEKTGHYQMYVSDAKLSGLGELYEKFLLIKDELESMGMFAPMYKKEIPKYAMTIGIITSDTGAALQDIINVSKRRNPYVKLILAPCLVQGESSKDSIVRAIKRMDKLNPDVMIVGRGGGSIEDLWAFNERCVAEAIFECNTPIISAVGHEVDFTIADFVSDFRAPTPSAAAEIAVFSYENYLKDIDHYEKRILSFIEDKLHKDKSELDFLSNLVLNTFNFKLNHTKTIYLNMLRNIDMFSPQNIILGSKHQIAESQDKLSAIILNKLNQTKNLSLDKTKDIKYLFNNNLIETKHSFIRRLEKIDNISPHKKMLGGYSFVSDKKGCPIKSINSVDIGQNIDINVIDGTISAQVLEKN